MRAYGTVSPMFWTGKTGRQIRGDIEAQAVCLYLMTSPHSTMTGVFHCPVNYIANDTGIPFEGASKGLRRGCEVGFCSFDEDLDLVWVRNMARFQVGEVLKPGDKRIISVRKEFDAMPKCLITFQFFERYRGAFQLPDRADLAPFARGSEGPSMPLRSQEQEHGQEHDHEQDQKNPPYQGEQASKTRLYAKASEPALPLGKELISFARGAA